VLFGIGGADLNDGDEAFEAGQCRMERCYAPVLEAFGRNFDATVAEVRKAARLRGDGAAGDHDAQRADGRRGRHPAVPPPGLHAARHVHGQDREPRNLLLNHEDCCYASGKGQQLMAELLLDTGLAPVR
jgi:hypothetical protein